MVLFFMLLSLSCRRLFYFFDSFEFFAFDLIIVFVISFCFRQVPPSDFLFLRLWLLRLTGRSVFRVPKD